MIQRPNRAQRRAMEKAARRGAKARARAAYAATDEGTLAAILNGG